MRSFSAWIERSDSPDAVLLTILQVPISEYVSGRGVYIVWELGMLEAVKKLSVQGLYCKLRIF